MNARDLAALASEPFEADPLVERGRLLAERVAEVLMKAREAIPISAQGARIARDDLTRGDFGWNLFGWATRRHLAGEFD